MLNIGSVVYPNRHPPITTRVEQKGVYTSDPLFVPAQRSSRTASSPAGLSSPSAPALLWARGLPLI